MAEFPVELWESIPADIRERVPQAEWCYLPYRSPAVWRLLASSVSCERNSCTLSPVTNSWYICPAHALPEELDGVPVTVRGQNHREGMLQFIPVDDFSDYRARGVMRYTGREQRTLETLTP